MTEFQPDQPEDLIRSIVKRLGQLERQGGTGTAIAASTFVGKVEITATAAAPTGWLLCDGASYLRTTYPALFAAIGTTYGAADGTHFNVPNAKGRVIVGRDAAQTEFDALGETGGAKTVTLTEGQMPLHDHEQNVSVPIGGPGVRVDYVEDGSSSAFPQGIYTNGAGNNEAHPNLQPYIVMNYIIKT